MNDLAQPSTLRDYPAEEVEEAANNSKHYDVMVDIESLSTHKYNAVILAIAAIPFTIQPTTANHTNAVKMGKSWLMMPQIVPQLMAGREVSASTQAWWAHPDQKDAWRGWEDQTKAFGPVYVADCFAGYYKQEGFKRIWANGICFDVNNIESLLMLAGRKDVWAYNAPRDARTEYKTRIASVERHQRVPDHTFAAHDPVGDCADQIWRLWVHGVATEGE